MNSQSRRRIHEKGQALVETAIVLLFLFLLVFGITEFGRAMYLWNSMNNLARGAARLAVVTNPLQAAVETSLNGNCGDNVIYTYICNNATPGVTTNDVLVTIDVFKPDNTPRTGNALPGDTVTITAKLTNFASLLPDLVPITDTLTGKASMRYE